MTFKDLFSHPDLLQAIEDAGYTDPTQIQQEAIPEVVKGSDLQACAQTGTGKTAAFILPALLKVLTPSEIKGKGPRVLVLVPTRELAMQVAAEATKYSKRLSMVKTVCIFGGQPFPIQNKELSRHYEILVATPGRLIDHMERGRIDFSRLEMLVLDEADRMLDMGFIDDVEHIAEMTPENRQTLMFSATLKPSVLKLSKRLLKNPIEIRITPQVEEHKQIEQKLTFVDNITHKYNLLEDILIDPAINQAIVFTATKRHADELSEKLCDMGHTADVLHGDLKQAQRTRTINKMRQGKIRILVATDVAARGIDVPTITHVINFDLPNNAEDYVHRIGRTGRAGATGIAISFVSPKDRFMIREIERFTGKKLLPEGEDPGSRRDSGSRGRFGGNSRGSSRSDRPRQERSYDRQREDRPRQERNFERQREDHRPRQERNFERQPEDHRPKKERSYDRPREERTQEDRPPREKRNFEPKERIVNQASFESRGQENQFKQPRQDREGKPHFGARSDSRSSSKYDKKSGEGFGSQKASFENRKGFGQKSESFRGPREQRNEGGWDRKAKEGQGERQAFWKKSEGFKGSKGPKADRAPWERRDSKEGFRGKKQVSPSGSGGYFEGRNKKTFAEKRDGEFQGSNAHREKAKAKASAGHRGQNSTFPRKRGAPVHGQNVVKRKDVPLLPTEA